MMLVENIKRWYRRKKYAENSYWKALPIYKETGEITIEILKGKFKNAIVEIGAFRFIDENSNKATFDYIIVSKEHRQYANNRRLESIIGSIFLQILESAINYSYEVKESILNGNEEDRTDYPEESTAQRTVFKESSTLSEE